MVTLKFRFALSVLIYNLSLSRSTFKKFSHYEKKLMKQMWDKAG